MDNTNGQLNTNREVEFASYYETKIGKLVTALYMITNFFPDTEPMKWKLRDRGLSLLSAASELKDRPSAKRGEMLETSLQVLKEVVALLEIAHLSDFITQMNYTVLRNEYVAMIELLSDRHEVKSSLSNFSLQSNFFDTPALKKELPEANRGKQVTAWGVERSYSEMKQNDRKEFEEQPVSRSEYHASLDASQKDNNVQAHVAKRTGSKVAKKRNKRRDAILDVLQEVPEVTIKDVAKRLTDCSEKTIQRQLVSMVKDGTLKKTGERRWSRYSLASS